MSNYRLPEPCAVPLVEELASVPADARILVVEGGNDTFPSSRSIPVGRLAQEAAARIAELEQTLEAEIDALKAKIAEMEKQEPVGQFDVDVEGGVSWFLKARKVYDCDKLYLAPGAKEVSPYAPVGVVVPDLKGGASINWDESFVLNPGAVLLVQANQAAKVKEQP